jgi:ribosomal protein S4
VIARAGIASRRRAEDLITEGKVKVNGEVIRVPQHPVLLSSAEKVRMNTLQFIACQIAAIPGISPEVWQMALSMHTGDSSLATAWDSSPCSGK